MLAWSAGFHLYKRQLDAMPNRDEAYARRGAHWTFDAERFVQAVRTLKQQGAAVADLLMFYACVQHEGSST